MSLPGAENLNEFQITDQTVLLFKTELLFLCRHRDQCEQCALAGKERAQGEGPPSTKYFGTQTLASAD